MLPSPSRLQPTAPAWNQVAAPAPDLRVLPPTPRVAVLLNANAKKVNERVREQMAAIVPEEDLYFSTSLEEAADFSASIVARRYGTVLLGGGDGTIANTLNLMIKAAREQSVGHRNAQLPDVGILRLGTGNGLANLCGAGRPADDVQYMLQNTATARPLRLVEDADSGFVFPFASVGYDAQVLNDYVDMVDGARTQFSRNLAKTLPGYFWAIGTRTIPTEWRSERAKIRLVASGRASILDPETDEEIPLEPNATLFEGSARAVAWGSTPFYGYGMRILPHANRRNDRFHMRISTASISFLLSHLPSLWKGSLRTPDFVDFLVEGVQLESSHELPLQMAGDARGRVNKLNLRLAERTFRLVEGTGKKLS